MMRALIFFVLVQSSLALKILLTNEAGIEDEGLTILRDALLERGHHVWTFAPKDDMTGMGAALSMPNVKVKAHGKAEEKMWEVDGTPATAVLVGVSKMTQKNSETHKPMPDPDLIISGINVGYASGPMDIHSGAVSSVLTALGKDIPAFCILTNLAQDIDKLEHFEHASVFVSHLVDVLVEQMVVFPIGVGLKIGYPAKLPKDIPQVILAGYGHYNPFSYGYYEDPDRKGVFRIGPAPSAQKFHEDSDAHLVEAGNIGVLAISNDVSLHKLDDNAYFVDDIAHVLAETDSRWERHEKSE
ncbi:5'-nucleotidase SurE [Seminavis robusta]|uniref:5'-nucleotidase SurE n=1 Tax=Seminavis robusta TaxID=568900 RepID=A0A9N8HKD6_9STRA|nr:5'-nucleotidase SurE [Seminavis robusta]|eukprot:Sro830_g208220.1 5'-nucleotidase SurE (299) ;mRNA; r:19466-20475